jgi:hypothetical protein
MISEASEDEDEDLLDEDEEEDELDEDEEI